MNPQPEPLAELIQLAETGGCRDSGSDASRNAPADAAAADRRVRSDRRRQPTSRWAAILPAGRRLRNRRSEEHRQPYFTDRFSAAIFVGILTLIAATFVDAGLTVHVLRGGGCEVNPLMRRLLSQSVEAFVIGKYLLTVVGLPVLLIFRNHYLFGTRLRVGYLIPVSVALYVVLIGYQVTLINQRIGW